MRILRPGKSLRLGAGKTFGPSLRVGRPGGFGLGELAGRTAGNDSNKAGEKLFGCW